MRSDVTGRGFRIVTHPRYLEPHDEVRVVQESSAIGDYEDSMDLPGSSSLWVGPELHLNREEVSRLAEILAYWMEHKRLPEPEA